MKKTSFYKEFVNLLQNRIASLGFILVLVIFVTSIIFPKTFATSANMQSIALNMSVNAIVAIGMMILLAAAGIDLSVGAVLALSGATVAKLIAYYNFPIPAAIAVTLLICAAIGYCNGFLIAKVGVNNMIVTLSTMGLVRGIAMLVAGSGITNLPSDFVGLTDWQFLGFRAPVYYMLIFVAVFAVLVARTRFFRRYYYIGGNSNAAKLSGINVVKMNILAYVLSAVLAGIAGVIQVARMGAAVSSIGQGLEMTAITACVLGGSSMTGGYGSVIGAVLGIVFTSIVDNVMIMARVNSNWQDIIVGIILIVAVSTDVLIKKNRIKAK